MARHGSINLETLKTKPSICKKAKDWWLLRVMGRLSYGQIADKAAVSESTVYDYVQTYAESVREFQLDTDIQNQIAYCDQEMANLIARRKKANKDFPENHKTYLAYTKEIGVWTDRLHELQGLKEAKAAQSHLHLTQIIPGGNLQGLTEADRKEIYDIANRRRINSPPKEGEAGEQSGT